ncbi:hypothetical protein ACIA8R_50335 [Nonomuraea sp. NPDC051191]|uniref:hypothetical protein n=2 Tax=unclassified Nonomuraea TaxID=2593643 RepID=UPI00378D360B
MSEWLQIASFFGVVVALLLTTLQLRLVSRQSQALTRSMQYGDYRTLVGRLNEFRTVHLRQDPKLLAWVLSTRGFAGTRSADLNNRRIYMIGKVDIFEGCYLSRKNGLMPDDVWLTWQRIMRADVKIKEFQEVWPIARVYYDLEFGRFMDEMMRAECP